MKRFAGAFLVLVSAAGFGAMPLFAHFAYQDQVNVSTLLFFRFFIAFLLMAPITFFRRDVLPGGKDLLILLAMGLVGYSGASFCYFTALTLIPAALVAILLYLYPVNVTLLSVLIYREPLTVKKVMALGLALAGTVLVVGFVPGSSIKGIGIGAMASVFYSCYILAGSRVMKRHHPFPSSVVIIGAASLFYLGYSIKAGFTLPSSAAGGISMVCLAIVSTFMAIFTFFMGVKLTGPVNASLLSTFEPVATIGLFFLVFGTPITPVQGFGTLLILLSAVVTALEVRPVEMEPR